MEVICANCGDLIKEVDDEYVMTLFQHMGTRYEIMRTQLKNLISPSTRVTNTDLVIIDTVGCSACKYGSDS